MLFFVSAILTALSFAVFFDCLSVLQQCGYEVKNYLKWLYKSKNKVFCRAYLSVLPLLIISLLKEILSFDDTAYIVFYGVWAYICAYVLMGSYKIRVRAKLTKRLIRIIILTVALSFLSFFSFDFLVGALLPVSSSYSVFIVFSLPLYLALSTFLLSPLDRKKYRKYIEKCKKRLGERAGLIKIGITGSAGKTSVKEYLAEILSYDFHTYATPKSYNTPMGICLAVKDMPKSAEVFIAEMGARRRGDIAELCEIVKPKIGIITSVLPQHMETFNSLETVKNTKYELIEGLIEGGTAVFNADNEETVSLYRRAKCKKILAGISGKEVRAESVKITGKGTEFILKIGNVRRFVATKLLGRHNVTNICLAVAAARELGVSIERIIPAISKLSPPEHRMQLITTPGGINVIDDGYNANIDGVKSAAETLKEIAGRKFAVFSGIAEGGKFSRELNEEAGKALSGAVDVLIAVGAYADFICSGADGGNCKIVKAKDLTEAKEILKTHIASGDTAIFINDLPDRY